MSKWTELLSCDWPKRCLEVYVNEQLNWSSVITSIMTCAIDGVMASFPSHHHHFRTWNAAAGGVCEILGDELCVSNVWVNSHICGLKQRGNLRSLRCSYMKCPVFASMYNPVFTLKRSTPHVVSMWLEAQLWSNSFKLLGLLQPSSIHYEIQHESLILTAACRCHIRSKHSNKSAFICQYNENKKWLNPTGYFVQRWVCLVFCITLCCDLEGKKVMNDNDLS